MRILARNAGSSSRIAHVYEVATQRAARIDDAVQQDVTAAIPLAPAAVRRRSKESPPSGAASALRYRM